nr:MAG TPA: cold inducible protein [Caudoviricetes sp.]
MVRITAFDDNGVYKIDFEIPELDECPICHHALNYGAHYGF